MPRDETIICVECGGRAHLIGFPPPDDDDDEAVLTYRCADCGARWDVVTAEESEHDPRGDL